MDAVRQALDAIEPVLRQDLPMVRAVVIATRDAVLWESYVAGTERDLIWDGSVQDGIPEGPPYPLAATAEQLHSVKSVTKSVLALLLGIVVERGAVEGIDTAVGDVLAGAGDKAPIRLRDLLAMRSGLEWEENGDITSRYLQSGDALRFTLEEQAVVHDPGAVAEYSTADSHLLGCCLAAATGMRLEALAEQWLFAPLGIDDYRWLRDATGAVIGGSELFLRPRDMAKIGVAILNGGEPVVSSAWLDYVTTAQPDVDLAAWARGLPVSPLRTGYAHHFWRGCIGGHPVRFAHGLGGQTIQVFDDRGLVVVTTTDSRRDVEADQVLDPALVVSDRYLLPALGGR